jgi:DNA-binding transcriptional LysR family regulator
MVLIIFIDNLNNDRWAVPSLNLIDTRLLRLFETIYAVRNVTRAAELLGLSQPTVSIGLGKLRAHFGDPLFVRTTTGMQPTPPADALIGQVRDMLEALRQISQWEAHFDPAMADRTFRICMTDASHVALLPQLLAHVRKAAPHVRLEAARIDADMPQALQSGRADLAVGLIPGLGVWFLPTDPVPAGLDLPRQRGPSADRKKVDPGALSARGTHRDRPGNRS